MGDMLKKAYDDAERAKEPFNITPFDKVWNYDLQTIPADQFGKKWIVIQHYLDPDTQKIVHRWAYQDDILPYLLQVERCFATAQAALEAIEQEHTGGNGEYYSCSLDAHKALETIKDIQKGKK